MKQARCSDRSGLRAGRARHVELHDRRPARRRSGLVWRAGISTAMLLAALPCVAQTTHYYYDPLGREIATYREASQDELYNLDSADNRNTLNASQTTSPGQVNVLNSGQELLQGDALQSTDGSYQLAFQTDGNLVLYQGGTALWNSGSNGQVAAYTVMQNDGNLVIYDPTGTVVAWQSGTNGNNGAYLSVTTSGTIQIISSTGTVLWSKP